MAVNIDVDRPNSHYTKIGVTEKSYDFVTFLQIAENYLMTIQYMQNILKNRNSINYINSEQKSCIDGLWECHLIGYTLKGNAIDHSNTVPKRTYETVYTKVVFLKLTHKVVN
ncbi:hypothetical protein C6497_08915 [Candidatus Poribacteria bacterium]|nr:MAG: hypothetical protein C6497_08915 [Candidatus Poribacteria bacterium]